MFFFTVNCLFSFAVSLLKCLAYSVLTRSNEENHRSKRFLSHKNDGFFLIFYSMVLSKNILNRRMEAIAMVSVHFAVTFLDCWRTSFCVTTIIKIVNNNTNNKQTSRGGGRITLNLIKNVAVIRSFSYKTKILKFFNLFNKIILLSQFTNSCLFTLDRLPFLLLLRKN